MQEIQREQEWKNIHKRALLNESFVEVSLEITDPEALQDAEAEDNGSIYISDSYPVAETMKRITHPYCTLEQNLWCLDGRRQAIPESDFMDNTYTSDVLSDETCVFPSKRPTITILFDKIHDNLVPGITVTWSETYNEFADTFEVVVYKEEEVILTKEVTGNKSIKAIVPFDIVNYDRVDIIIKKWCLPHRRARVEEIIMGIDKVYGKGELFGYSHKQFVDPVSTSLPKSEITFSVDNVDGGYDPNDPQSLSRYLMERQELKVRYGLKMDDGSIEWIDGGVFFLSEWYAKQNGMTADFTARDMFEFMTGVYKDSLYYFGYKRDLYTLAERLLDEALRKRGANYKDMYVIDESLKNVTTSAQLPEDTIANNLQLIANAARCVLYQDRSGVIRIEPFNNVDTDYEISSFNSYSKSEISLSKPLRQVKVKMDTYEITGTNDGTITSTEVAYPADADIPTGATGETIVVDNPLVTDEDNARALGEWMYSYLKNRMTLESSWRADVRLDALDIVHNVNAHNTNRVRMTDVEYTYNGAFRGTGKGKVIGNG